MVYIGVHRFGTISNLFSVAYDNPRNAIWLQVGMPLSKTICNLDYEMSFILRDRLYSMIRDELFEEVVDGHI